MGSITLQHTKGGITYISFSRSFWNPERKCPDNTKIRLGRFSKSKKEIIFNKNYYNLSDLKGQVDALLEQRFPEAFFNSHRDSTLSSITQNTDKVNDINIFNNRELLNNYFNGTLLFGFFYFMLSIATSIDLLNNLINAFPSQWRTIFIIACYNIFNNGSINDINDWVKNHYVFKLGNNLTSQRLSEFFYDGINEIEQHNFYRNWFNSIIDKEFVALDTTSISTYSENLNLGEYGRNKKRELLKQINICLLYGEESHLPVYQIAYSGSLKDVKVVRSILDQFRSIVGKFNITIVLDKGFYSNRNIKHMKSHNYRFIMSVPFTTKKVLNLIEEVRSTINNQQNLIITSSDPILGVSKLCNWYGDLNVYSHIYYNPLNNIKERNALYTKINDLINLYKLNKLSEDQKNDFNKYVIINKNLPITYKKHLIINNDEIEKSLQTSGWFVFITNTKYSTQRVYTAYRLKDCVEKSFCSYNNTLCLNRFRVHNDKRAINKTFVSFISLILESHIRKILSGDQLKNKITLNKLIIELCKIKCFVNKDDHICTQLITATHEKIFDAFNVPIPKEEYSSDDYCINRE